MVAWLSSAPTLPMDGPWSSSHCCSLSNLHSISSRRWKRGLAFPPHEELWGVFPNTNLSHTENRASWNPPITLNCKRSHSDDIPNWEKKGQISRGLHYVSQPREVQKVPWKAPNPGTPMKAILGGHLYVHLQRNTPRASL